MDAALAGLIGAFGGAGIGLAGAIKVGSDQRRSAERIEKQGAFANYLGAVYTAVSELQEMPAETKPSLPERVLEKLSSDATNYVRDRKGLAAMGNTHLASRDRLASASAIVQVLGMPNQVIDAFNEANEYVIRLSEDRGGDTLAEWPAIHQRLHAAAELLR